MFDFLKCASISFFFLGNSIIGALVFLNFVLCQCNRFVLLHLARSITDWLRKPYEWTLGPNKHTGRSITATQWREAKQHWGSHRWLLPSLIKVSHPPFCTDIFHCVMQSSFYFLALLGAQNAASSLTIPLPLLRLCDREHLKSDGFTAEVTNSCVYMGLLQILFLF